MNPKIASPARIGAEPFDAALDEAGALAAAVIATGSDPVHLAGFLRAIPLAERHEDVRRLVEATCESIGARAQAILLDGNRRTRRRTPSMDSSVFEPVHGDPRMFRLGERTVLNHERVTVIIEPTGDPSFDGPLRDTAAVLAECIGSHFERIEAQSDPEPRNGQAGRQASRSKDFLLFIQRAATVAF